MKKKPTIKKSSISRHILNFIGSYTACIMMLAFKRGDNAAETIVFDVILSIVLALNCVLGTWSLTKITNHIKNNIPSILEYFKFKKEKDEI